MTRILNNPMRWLIAVAVLVALALPTIPALGQTTTTTEITVDTPAANSTIANGTQVLIGGWAVDRTATSGSGIDQVRVYLDGAMDAGGTLLGSATSGGNRPDVAAALGNPNFANSGFDFLWTPTNLSGGSHTIYVYAHVTATNSWAHKTVPLMVTAQPTATPMPVGPGPGMWPGGPGMGPGGIPYPHDLYPPQPPLPPLPPPPPPPLYPPPSGQPCILIYPPPPGCDGSGTLPGPTSVTPAAVTGTTVTLIWSPVPGAVSYQVAQAVGASDMFTPAAVTNVSPVSATVTGLTPLTTYSFRVMAVDASGRVGIGSNAVTVTTTALP